MQKITTIEQLRDIIGPFTDEIITQVQQGDPDWLIDLIKELDYLTPASTWWITEFHTPCKNHNLTSQDFDTDAILKQINQLP